MDLSSYHLEIVTPDGLHFDGQAEKLTVRTVSGDVCILANHMNYVTALGMGEAKVFADGSERVAACIGGILSVDNNHVRLVPTTFEWSEDIDIERAAKSEAKARQALSTKNNLSRQSVAMAEARLKRSLLRQNVAKHK